MTPKETVTYARAQYRARQQLTWLQRVISWFAT
jgi:hypothetical protein